MHHAGRSTAKRWSDLEKLQQEYEGIFRFHRLHLTRGQASGNLLNRECARATAARLDDGARATVGRNTPGAKTVR